MNFNAIKSACFALILVLPFCLNMTAAHADILTSPLRLVMEGRERSGQVVLINTGNKTNTYEIKWRQYAQDPETGGYIVGAEKVEGVVNLQDIAVFSPRKVTLAPGERQVVRFGIRRPADLPDGEYKSHISFRVQPKALDLQPKADQLVVATQLNTSFSIPAVYRVGDYDARISIGDPMFEVQRNNSNLQVVVPLKRAGIHGVMGELYIYHQPKGEDEVLLRRYQNVNLFAEVDSRNVVVPIDVSGLAQGNMRIVYKKSEGTSAADDVVMAEKEFPIVN